MQELPDTRESLLSQVRDKSNHRAWQEFVDLYRPAVYRIALARGLQHFDALDLVQTVFISVAEAIGEWERRTPQVRFRHWLLRVARNATINALTRRPPDQPLAGIPVDELLEQIPEQSRETETLVLLEYRRALFQRAAELVRVDVHPDTWKSFELTAIDGMSKEAAARELGKSVGTIYAARSRVMKRHSMHDDRDCPVLANCNRNSSNNRFHCPNTVPQGFPVLNPRIQGPLGFLVPLHPRRHRWYAPF